jgi:hypothetical protein
MTRQTESNRDVEITLDCELTKLEEAVLTALDDVVKPNEAYNGGNENDNDAVNDFASRIPLFSAFLLGKIDIDRNDEAELEAYRSWIKRSSTHRFNLEELRKRIENDWHIAPFTIDEVKQAVLDLTTLNSLFDAISIACDEGEAYFSFGAIVPLVFDSNENDFKGYGRAVVNLKRSSKRKRSDAAAVKRS